MSPTQTLGLLEWSQSIKVNLYIYLKITDNFNENMKAIETQFRAGNISFLEQKHEEVFEPINTVMTTTSEVKKNRHRKKRSVLIKNFDQLSRHSNYFLVKDL